MQHGIEDSHCVLIVCTPTYKQSFERRNAEQPGGYGSTWEAALISQELYENKLHNDRFIPILPDGGERENVPTVLRDFCNELTFPSQQERIFKAIVDDALDPNANVRPYRRRPPGLLTAEDTRLAPDLRDVYGRDEEIRSTMEFLDGADSAAQVVAQVTGTGGIGKTEICKRALRLWLQQNPGSRVFWVGVPDGASPEVCANAIARALGYDRLETLEQLMPVLKPGIYYLDNLESLDSPEGNAFLRQLQGVSGVRLLASSRARLSALGAPIEVYALAPDDALRTFQDAWTGQPNELRDAPSLRSFLQQDLGGHPLSIVLMAALGNWKSVPQLISDWKREGTRLLHSESDPSRRGSLITSLSLTSRALASRHSGALPLWTAAALFSDNLDGEILSILSKHLSTDERALQLLTQHRVLRRENEHYHMLVPVARFALDQAQRGASGFDWRAVREALNPFFLGIAQSADSIASTDTALKAQHTLIRHFGAWHRYALELCRETPPALNLIAQLHEKLHNQYQFQPSLGREMAQAIEAALSGHPQYDRTRAGALQSLGDLEQRLDNLEQARAHYRDALERYQKVQDDLGKANTLQSLGDLEQRLDNLEQA